MIEIIIPDMTLTFNIIVWLLIVIFAIYGFVKFIQYLTNSNICNIWICQIHDNIYTNGREVIDYE